jgi:Phage tail fibre repeat
MSTNYPGALDSFVNPTATDTLDSATVPHAAQHDNINDAMAAVQVTLGVNPQGGSATVVARLTAIENSVSGKVSSVSGTSPISVTSGTTPTVSIQSASTTQSGAVQLTDSTSSTSTTTAATPNSVKTVADSNALKAPLASPALTGTPTVPTASVDTNTTQIASTAFVLGQASAVAPNMDGTAAVGTSTRYARADHVHATDTSRAASGANSDITSLTGLTTPLSVGQGGTGASTFTSGNALIGNGTGAVTSVGVTTTGANSNIVKTSTTGGITAGTGGVASLGSVATGSGAGSAGSLKVWASAIGSSVTITPPSLGIGATADQVLPIVGGILVSNGMTGSNAQVTSGMIVDGTIVDGDISTSAAIQQRKLEVVVASVWNGAGSYSVGDLVTYQGAYYIRRAAGTSATAPIADSTNWALRTPVLAMNNGDTAYAPAGVTATGGLSVTGLAIGAIPTSAPTAGIRIDNGGLSVTNAGSGILVTGSTSGTASITHVTGSSVLITTPADSGVMAVAAVTRNNTANTLSQANSATLSPVFNTGQRVLTLAPNTTYYFELFYGIVKAVSTTAGAATHQIGFAFTQTPQLFEYEWFSTPSSATGTAILGTGFSTVRTAVSVGGTAGTTANTAHIRATGFFTTNATTGGTITPQFCQSLAGDSTGPTANAGSWFRVTPFQTSSTSVAGAWA